MVSGNLDHASHNSSWQYMTSQIARIEMNEYNLEYATTILDPDNKFNFDILEKYQRRAVIFVNGDY